MAMPSRISTSAQADETFFTDRPTFEAASPGLVLEGFGDATVIDEGNELFASGLNAALGHDTYPSEPDRAKS